MCCGVRWKMPGPSAREPLLLPDGLILTLRRILSVSGKEDTDMRYDQDITVIGGGAAGLVAATGAAALGARTLMIEKEKLGGDCTWYGCVPSKALLKSSQVFHCVRNMAKAGIYEENSSRYDTSGVMEHVRGMIEKISQKHPPEVFEEKGIEVLFGSPRFVDNRTVEVEGRRIRSKRFILCTGSHPIIPPVEGLEEAGPLTSDNVWDLERLPESMVIMGGGPIGVELSQAFARLGTEVTLIEAAERLLLKEEEEMSDFIAGVLKEDGVDLRLSADITRVEKRNGGIEIALKNGDKITAEKILVAAGRAPSLKGLELENAGVEYTEKGVVTDKVLRTTARNVYACGDMIGSYQFSHTAEYQAITAVGNAVIPFKRSVEGAVVPWCTFTDPEIARAGMTETEARESRGDIRVYRTKYKDNDRAVTDMGEKGLVKLICDKKGYILGAHIAGANAGEIIHECVLAMSAGLKTDRISSAIHIYPTLSQLVKRTADQPLMKVLDSKMFKTVMKFMIRIMR
ncbi:MAG: FAD-dependent oxidoreductase [Candidatus Omnitrophica bacterium]|nr:FAD-dependent oxidoreductase [Candidatus Omnitrophota bacterium]